MSNKTSHELIEIARERLKKNRVIYKKELSQKLDRFVYWTSLAMLALFNLIACFFLIPFLMFFEGFYLYLSVAGFGFTFGFLFNLLIMGIEHLKNRHHIIAGIFIPVLAVLDIVLILNIVDRINMILKHPVNYGVSMVIIVFITAFILPYMVAVVTGRHKF